jgi:hypothetical protein
MNDPIPLKRVLKFSQLVEQHEYLLGLTASGDGVWQWQIVMPGHPKGKMLTYINDHLVEAYEYEDESCLDWPPLYELPGQESGRERHWDAP